MSKETPAPKRARKPKSATAPKAKRKSPSARKRKGETTPAEDAHERILEMAEIADSTPPKDWIKASAEKIPDEIEPPEYGAARAAEYAVHRPPETAKVGRPPDYKPEFAVLAEKLCKYGATDAELAEEFRVDVRTIYRWTRSHDEFCQALRNGKEHADERVERSMFMRAVGYSKESVKVFLYQGEPVVARYEERIDPDVGAAAKWLSARRPEVWRDKQELNVNLNHEEALAALTAAIHDSDGQDSIPGRVTH